MPKNAQQPRAGRQDNVAFARPSQGQGGAVIKATSPPFRPPGAMAKRLNMEKGGKLPNRNLKTNNETPPPPTQPVVIRAHPAQRAFS